MENEKRSPSASLIDRYWKSIPSWKKERASVRLH